MSCIAVFSPAYYSVLSVKIVYVGSSRYVYKWILFYLCNHSFMSLKCELNIGKRLKWHETCSFQHIPTYFDISQIPFKIYQHKTAQIFQKAIRLFLFPIWRIILHQYVSKYVYLINNDNNSKMNRKYITVQIKGQWSIFNTNKNKITSI